MKKATSIISGIFLWSSAAIIVICATLGAQIIGAMLIVGKYATAIVLLKSLYQ